MVDIVVPLLGADILLPPAARSVDALGHPSCGDWWRIVYKDGATLKDPVSSITPHSGEYSTVTVLQLNSFLCRILLCP